MKNKRIILGGKGYISCCTTIGEGDENIKEKKREIA